MKPIIPPKYNIGIRVENCNAEILPALEPWCDCLCVDIDFSSYLESEQKNTSIDLSKKINSLDFECSNDIVVNINGSTFNNTDFNYIQQLSQIIQNSGSVGEFNLGNLFIKIDKLVEYQNKLIKA